jgi:hypothetical protein
MRAPLICAVVVALVAAAAAQRSGATPAEPAKATKAPTPVLGISNRWPGGRLAWFEPLTLRMLPGRKTSLGRHYGSWAFSADRATLAIASCGDTRSRGIRFVNARAMRVLGDLQLSRSFSDDCTSSLTWLASRRLLAVVQTASETSVVLVDPVARRVLRREALPAGPWATGRTRDELVVLLGNHGSFAPARLAVVDAEGRMRITTVERITAGTIEEGEGSEYRSRAIQPGLAVDPGGRRAFVVPHAGPVAEIDLRTLAVSYHELDRPSLFGRLLRWLTPAAQAKVLEGPIRQARWLGDGMIAVSGVDYSITANAGGQPLMTAAPAGVSLVDTRSWRARELDDEASGFAVGAGLVVAQGGRWDSGQERGYGPGLRAFGLDGRERWRLHPGEYRWLDPAGPVGYVQISELSTEVVDLVSGSVLATVRWDVGNPTIQQPQLLAAQVSDW